MINTVNIGENEGTAGSKGDNTDSQTKDFTNIPDREAGESEHKVKFPKRLRHRGKGKALATIYKGKRYTLYWRIRVNGKPRSRFKEFKNYTEAKREGDKVVSDLMKGRATVLTPGQVADALNGLEELQRFHQTTGKHVSIRFAVGAYCEAARKLDGRTLTEAVDGFLTTVATVKRVDLGAAVKQFIDGRKAKTIAKDGKRPQLSPSWHYIVSMWLREFAATFPGHATCDLGKSHLDAYISGHSDVSAGTRNGRRAVVKLFLRWCVRQNYLPSTHRLFEADSMGKEQEENVNDMAFYTPSELRNLLEGAAAKTEYNDLLPVISLGGLAGIRLQEIVRLTWKDVFGIRGHIEITSAKAKTRSRRLVQMCPALRGYVRRRTTRSGIRRQVVAGRYSTGRGRRAYQTKQLHRPRCTSLLAR